VLPRGPRGGGRFLIGEAPLQPHEVRGFLAGALLPSGETAVSPPDGRRVVVPRLPPRDPRPAGEVDVPDGMAPDPAIGDIISEAVFCKSFQKTNSYTIGHRG